MNSVFYTRAEILSWTQARKSGLMRLLKRWHEQFLVETLLETRGQRSLAKSDFTAERTVGDQHDLDDPSTGDGVT